MGQFIDQVQKITAQQNEILTERKRKANEKERKELLQYFLNKYKIKILNKIDISKNATLQQNFNDENIQEIFSQFNQDLRKHNFDSITTQLKAKELEDFTHKEITKQLNMQRKIQKEEASQSNWQSKLYYLMDKKYQEYKNPFQVFERLQI